MTTSDLDTLIEMGFDPERAELATKKTGSLQDAIDWLDKNADKPLDEIKGGSGDATAEGGEEPPALEAGEQPRSLVCDDCGKKFRSQAQAEWHASKTDHTNFSESTEEVKPLTEEEKKAKLEELKEKAALKRAAQAEEDKRQQKKNEEIRRMATKESHDIREQLQMKEKIKEVEKKKREKREEIAQRKKILEQIERDKEERRRKAEAEKAAREGRAVEQQPITAASVPAQPAKKVAEYTEARLRLQTASGNVMKSFPVDTTLFEVAQALQIENGTVVESFTQNFPRKVFDVTEFGMTLKEAGMVPSAALIVK